MCHRCQVRLNDRQLRTTFFLLQKTTRENEESTERVEQLEEARGFDRELMMAMTFHEVRNPLNGTMGHLQLARHVLQTAAANGGGGGGGGGGSGGKGDGAGGESTPVEAALEEVDASLVRVRARVRANPNPNPNP